VNLGEELTSQFYAWEKRGRGWAVSSYPVVLEPPFRPFFRYLPSRHSHDDARQAGFFERIWKSFQRGFERVDPNGSLTELEAELLRDPEPTPYSEDEVELIELQIRLPHDHDVSFELAGRLLLSLGGASSPVSFELIGVPERLILQVTVRADDAPIVKGALEAYAPEILVEERRGVLTDLWRADDSRDTVCVDFGLSKEFMLPLAVPRSLAVDPLLGFLAAIGDLKDDEIGVLQVIFQRTSYPWTESALRAITDNEGSAFFADAPETLALTREKMAHPLFAAVIRTGARASTRAQAWEITRRLGGALSQFSAPSSNEFIPLSNDEYGSTTLEEDMLSRSAHRSGMLLSSEELTALVHLPGPEVRHQSLRAPARKTKAAPTAYASGDVELGTNTHRGKTASVKLSRSLRLRHTYVIGATGTGKSTLLLNLIRQDIEAGRGFGLIDPHGDLVEAVLPLIPKSRHQDVVLFDPSDAERPIGFNILEARSAREKDLIASDLVAVFQRLSTSWGDQMTAVLGNAVFAFLESDRGGTLLDLRRFLLDREFRDEFLGTVHDPQVELFWKREFPLLTGRPQASILTRLDALLRPRQLRYSLAQKRSAVDLCGVMDEGKIFLAKLSQGAIGEENAHLIGSLLISKFYQMALSRDERPEKDRRDFFLYLDEFQHFRSPSLSALLAGARKYHLGLILAHQDLQQLGDRSLESSVLTNSATRICFRLGDDDARKLAAGFSTFEASDLQNLGVGEAICRIEQQDHDCNLRIPVPSTVDQETGEARSQEIRVLSRERYGRPRIEIEAIIAQDSTPSAEPTTEPRMRAPNRSERRQPPADEVRTETPSPVLERRPLQIPQPSKTASVRRRSSVVAGVGPSASKDGGRGGAQHKYLQSLIKHYAEEQGYRATVEASLPSGGRVDVLLERNGQSLACEISITSTPEQELCNLEKCLAAGLTRVATVSPDRRLLKRVEKLAKERLASELLDRTSFTTPEDLLVLIAQPDVSASAQQSEGTVLGYKVTTKLKGVGHSEQQEKTRTVAETIVRALKRLGRS